MKIEQTEMHTNDELKTFIPEAGRVLFNKTRRCLVVGDGETPGGVQQLPVSAASLSYRGDPVTINFEAKDTWTKINIYEATYFDGSSVATDPEDGSLIITLDISAFLGFFCSYQGAISQVYEFAMLCECTNIIDGIVTRGRMTNANDIVNAAAFGTYDFKAGEDIALFVRNTTGTGPIEISSASIVLFRST